MLTLKRPSPIALGSADRMDLDPTPVSKDGSLSHAGRSDCRALDQIGLETSLRDRILPLESAGAVTPIACADPEDFQRLAPELRQAIGPVAFRKKPRGVIETEILKLRAAYLARRAECRPRVAESCRTWSGSRTAGVIFAGVAIVLLVAFLSPILFVLALTLWSFTTLLALSFLRAIGAITALQSARQTGQWSSQRRDHMARSDLPVISLLVPLFDELNIAGHLIKRLNRLDYPRDKLDVCLILEHGDLRTEAALRHAELPNWMRIVHVPAGAIRTKPRAMNYALDFARGEIVGILDAEDAPALDQLRKVALGFHRALPDVACLQGVLDFYNAQDSWLTRCFAIDYAAWFRLVLPGLVRLGFVIPLGGTTVYFRRKALEQIGRWDAHNVTEDADLGLRLARYGFRCEFISSITEEEAPHQIWPWLKQRSRWIKGYAITWAVHMRNPLNLLGELGLKRFLGVQMLFFGTLSHFLLAPFLLSFWLILFGISHPVLDILPGKAVTLIGSLFFLSEILALITSGFAVATPRSNWLIKWVPMMHVYYPLAAIASWKSLVELITRPFFWDKTAHGKSPIIPQSEHHSLPPHPHHGEAGLRMPG